jgi:hypothetical protein
VELHICKYALWTGDMELPLKIRKYVTNTQFFPLVNFLYDDIFIKIINDLFFPRDKPIKYLKIFAKELLGND